MVITLKMTLLIRISFPKVLVNSPVCTLEIQKRKFFSFLFSNRSRDRDTKYVCCCGSSEKADEVNKRRSIFRFVKLNEIKLGCNQLKSGQHSRSTSTEVSPSSSWLGCSKPLTKLNGFYWTLEGCGLINFTQIRRLSKSKPKSRSQLQPKYSEDELSDCKPRPSPRKRSTSRNNHHQEPAKKCEEEQNGRKWWEEGPRKDGTYWHFLEHKGPVFAPPYEPLPENVNFRYNGKVVKLSKEAEEIAGFYARFIEHDYATKEIFNTNFFKDWRQHMTPEERDLIKDLQKCDFREINDYFKRKSEERKGLSKEEEKQKRNEEIAKEFGVALIDGQEEKIGNYRIEPPGLFRGRGDHPKMGMLKKRILPEDVIINCSGDSKWPEPPKGHHWKEVRHDNTVTWLASWTENIQGTQKYVFLNPTARLRGEQDLLKFDKARELASRIDKIRKEYWKDMKSRDIKIRQRAVAMYFIDKLALRTGRDKDEDQVDTVGCCSLRYEHIKLWDEKDGERNVVVFDFPGKDCIRYFKEVPVEELVFRNLKTFMKDKKEGDELFDKLNPAMLNKHLNELMNGLTAKVFRTYNASHILQQQLDELTPVEGSVSEKVLAYNRANRTVAVLCNHQRTVPKTLERSLENLSKKISSKREEVEKVKKELRNLRKGSKNHEKMKNLLNRLEGQLQKLEMNRTDKEEGKEIALGTSKLNYLDPRISVAWCKNNEVPMEKVYNKSQRERFRWAIDLAGPDYRFTCDS